MIMPVPPNDASREKQRQAVEMCLQAKGECLDLGKKISVPQDVMIEELNLLSNRGSRMFQERQRRVQKFTLERVGNQPCNHLQLNKIQCRQTPDGLPGKADHSSEDYSGMPSRTSLVTTLKHSVAKKGNPSVLAPGYSGPLKEVPAEKFNITVIPKSYYSPWEEPRASQAVLAAISAHLPKAAPKTSPANYRCFNRAPAPFGGTAGSMRTLPLPGFELLQTRTEPKLTWERMCHRPNFNRMPRGWRVQCPTQSTDL
ncbi:myozenin-2 [Electrophorus electricus]|uniref:Myozenin 3a n=2 Tax=Electrophorus TaxID=8004 RepID=A0A4W4GRS6_ELEEL|nr:myozenin-2 [Electrophorus electricus]